MLVVRRRVGNGATAGIKRDLAKPRAAAQLKEKENQHAGLCTTLDALVSIPRERSQSEGRRDSLAVVVTTSPKTGGQGAETGALANALERAGAVDVRSGFAPSEALVLAIGGGIGFHFATVGRGKEARPLLDGSTHGLSGRSTRIENACAALAIPVRVLDAPNDLAAENVLAEEAASAAAVLTWVDLASLPHHRLPRGYEGAIPRMIGVLSFDEAGEEFALDDGANVAVMVDALRLRSARAQAPGAPNRCVSLSAPTGAADLSNHGIMQLRTAMMAHLNAPIANRGLLGIRTLCTKMRAGSRRGSFQASYPRGEPMLFALAALYRFIECGPLGPALGRGLWSQSLAEISALAGLGVLEEECEAWDDVAKRWHNLAQAALPPETRRLAEVRQLLETQHARYQRDGLDAINLIVSTQVRMAIIAREFDAEFPLSEGEVADLLEDLGARLDDIAGLEQAAAERAIAITS